MDLVSLRVNSKYYEFIETLNFSQDDLRRLSIFLPSIRTVKAVIMASLMIGGLNQGPRFNSSIRYYRDVVARGAP